MTTFDESERTATKRTTTDEHPMSTADFASASADRTPVDHQTVERQPVDRTSSTDRETPLFPGTEAQGFQTRWSDIQVSFVDEPRQSVQQADALVAEVMQRLAQVFADERSRLEQQWDRGEQTDTEALRLALRRYRSFFDRLLSM